MFNLYGIRRHCAATTGVPPPRPRGGANIRWRHSVSTARIATIGRNIAIDLNGRFYSGQVGTPIGTVWVPYPCHYDKIMLL